LLYGPLEIVMIAMSFLQQRIDFVFRID